MTAESVLCLRCIYFTCNINLKPWSEYSVTALCQSGPRVIGERCSVWGIALQNFSCFIKCFIKKAYQKCVMNTFSWTVTGCRPQELQRKTRSQLLFHNCKGKPGNLALKRKSPFSMLNLSVQDKKGGTTGMCSTGLIKVKDTAVSVEEDWLYRTKYLQMH